MHDPLGPDFKALPGYADIQALPVLAILPELARDLEQVDSVVLQAAPGAGKTTCVPLALYRTPWLAGRKILMLEPRRLAARGAAIRMAELLGEPVGQTVGYRVRLESRVSQATRIEVVTEGILTRMLQDDPALEAYGLIIFDEFHERHLDGDLGLALCLKARQWFRNPQESDTAQALKLLLMSATLDDTRVADCLAEEGQAVRVIQSEGRQYPVSIHYGEPWRAGQAIVPVVAGCVRRVIEQHEGNVLVFLPGQAEIRACQKALRAQGMGGSDSQIELAPLYGDLGLDAQRRAILPSQDGRRKIVLATPIAESSLTIEGITVVVDSGLARVPQFDPNTGMTRLSTRRISKASSAQRAGRAGRLKAGHCYRLWSESQQSQMVSYAEPEIVQADLASLALQLMQWGIHDPDELTWLDAPPAGAFAQAISLLQQLGAIEKNKGRWRITRHGEAMSGFPTHPRLAHMLLVSRSFGLQDTACQLAALISERDPLERSEAELAGADVTVRLALLDECSGNRPLATRSAGPLLQRVRQYAQQFRSHLDASLDLSFETGKSEAEISMELAPGLLLACAYPDRIAQRRSAQTVDYLMANGRAVQLQTHDPLQESEWLVCAHVSGQKGRSSDRVYLAAALAAGLFEQAPLNALIQEREVVAWDESQQRLLAEERRHIGELSLSRKKLLHVDPALREAALMALVRKKGLSLLPWSDALQGWRARVSLLRELDAAGAAESHSEWPDLRDEALLDTLEKWLAPYLTEVSQFRDFSQLDLDAILKTMLPWPLPKKLDALAPPTFQVPSGSSIRIDYTQRPPVLAVRLQEMLGCEQTPTIAQGRIALMVHLLSPAQRPLAVTQDLANFWRQVYPEVKKEMKGRYPKHYWPDDPVNASATRQVKSRMQNPAKQ